MTEQQVIDYVKKKKDILPIIQTNIKLLTPNVQRAAVQGQHAAHIEYLFKIPNFQPIDEVKWRAIKWHGVNKNIKNLTYQMWMYIADNESHRLKYIKDKSSMPDDAKWTAIKHNPRDVGRLQPTQKMIQYALIEDPNVIGLLDHPTLQQIVKFAAGKAHHSSISKAIDKAGLDPWDVAEAYQKYKEENRLRDLRGIEK